MGLLSKMVTWVACWPWAFLSTSMRSLCLTCRPMGATSPLTLTQPLSIQSSASRREHRPSSAMRLFSRVVVAPDAATRTPGPVAFSADGGPLAGLLLGGGARRSTGVVLESVIYYQFCSYLRNRDKGYTPFSLKSSCIPNDQPVAHRRFRQQVPGLRRIELQLLPQMPHVNAQVVALFGMRRPPDFAQELAVRQHAAHVGDQHQQQAVFDRREVHLHPAAGHQAGLPVHHHVAKAEHRVKLR